MLFRSFSQPLIILAAVPFGLIGAFLAFVVHQVPLSFMGLVGIIGLSGVVVNDSIVMVDLINKLSSKLEPGTGKTKALKMIIDGAEKRLRPVLLTTLTTVAALLPTVYGIGGDVSSLRPAVMALSYGILFATFLTLFLIPVLYAVLLDIKGSKS